MLLLIVSGSWCFFNSVPLFPVSLRVFGESRAVPWCFAALHIGCAVVGVGSLIITVVCDPGVVVPRSSRLGNCRCDLTSGSQTCSGHVLDEGFAEERDVQYCSFCLWYVEGFDHHCRVIGACIGRRNMWSFLLFLTAEATQSFLTIAGGALYFCLFVDLADWWANLVLEVSLDAIVSILPSCRTAMAIYSLTAALYGGGYCAALCYLYWGSVFRGMHSSARRRRLREPNLLDFNGQAESGYQVDWRAVREVFSEHRRMELVSTVMDRELGTLPTETGPRSFA
jgi:hypothetical protein